MILAMGTHPRGQREIVEQPESDDEEPLPELPGIRTLVYVAAGVLALTLLSPLFFDSHRGELFAVAAGSVVGGCVLAAVIGTIAFSASGKSKRATCIGVSAGLLIAAIGVVTVTSLMNGKFEERDQIEANEATDQVAKLMAMQLQRAVETSSSARWVYSGEALQTLAERMRFENEGKLVAKLIRGCQPAITELAQLSEAHLQAVTKLHVSGLTGASIKTKKDCDARLEELKALDSTAQAELEALKLLPQRLQEELLAGGIEPAVVYQLIGKIKVQERMAAAIQLRELDTQYAKHATSFVTFMRGCSGKWSLIAKNDEPTIYFAQGVNIGEYSRLKRLVNDVYDRELAIQEQTMKIATLGISGGKGGKNANSLPPNGTSSSSNANIR